MKRILESLSIWLLKCFYDDFPLGKERLTSLRIIKKALKLSISLSIRLRPFASLTFGTFPRILQVEKGRERKWSAYSRRHNISNWGILVPVRARKLSRISSRQSKQPFTYAASFIFHRFSPDSKRVKIKSWWAHGGTVQDDVERREKGKVLRRRG